MFAPSKKNQISVLERVIIENVNQFGFHTNWVFEENDENPPYAYSIGIPKTISKIDSRRKLVAPEITIFGLPADTSHSIVYDYFLRCVNGLTVSEGDRVEGLFGDYDGVVRMVDESNLDYFQSAIWFHETQMGTSLESLAMLVWPDANNLYPWQAHCADWVQADQLPLYNSGLTQ